MRNAKQQTRNKVNTAVEAIDRKITRLMRDAAKGNEAAEAEVAKLRVKRSKLFKSGGR